jgi:hypothetical protein
MEWIYMNDIETFVMKSTYECIKMKDFGCKPRKGIKIIIIYEDTI